MSIPLIVNNSTFNYPEPGDPKGWGEDATGWATEVTLLLSDLKGPNDIIQTAFSINNNQAVASNIIGLAFDSATVRYAIVDYTIYRSTSTNEVAEGGQLHLIYKNVAATWLIEQDRQGDDSGVVITITNGGQLQYTSSNLAGLSYSGTISFRARTLNQV